MEIIKKQISIDACRSHKQGLLPFIHSIRAERVDKTSNENTNYSHFVCDLSRNTNVIKYLDIIRYYNEIKEIIRNGIFCVGKGSILKIVENLHFEELNGKQFDCCKENCECYEDIFQTDNDGNRITPLRFSDFFYKIKPLNINDFINKDGRYYEHISGELHDGCCILINNYNIYEEYEEWGKNNGISSSDLGSYFTFIQYVENNLIFKNNPVGFSLVTPTVDIHILLEEEYSIDTMYYPYEYTYSGEGTTIKINEEVFPGIIGEEIIEISDASLDTNDGHYDYIVYKKEKELYSGNTYTIESKLPITVESKLQSLIHPTAINFGYNSVINDDVFGIPSGEIKMIKNNSSSEYIKVPFKSCIKTSGNYLVEYYNDEDIINIPFFEGVPVNIEEGKCDVVDKITYENGYAIIDYILGARLNKDNTYQQNTGIKYREKLILISKEINIKIDNIDCIVNYKYVDYDTNLETVYNEEYKTYIDIRKAEIIGMPIGSIYNTRVKQPLMFTKEGSDSLISTPKIDIDLTFNRGNAAGWEKHFKLSECNTMQDLENYGNNFFNL